MKTERGRCAMAFLKTAVAYYSSLGVTILCVMTDNGSCYRSKAFARACRRLSFSADYGDYRQLSAASVHEAGVQQNSPSLRRFREVDWGNRVIRSLLFP